MRNVILIPLIAIFCAASALTAQEPTEFFRYQGDYVGGSDDGGDDADFRRLAERSHADGVTTFAVPYDPEVPLSPTEGYTGPVFYGGYQTTIADPDNEAASGFFRQQVRLNNSIGDAIAIVDDYNGPAAERSLAGFIAFKQESFDGDFATDDVGLDTLTIQGYVNSDDLFPPNIHLLIKKDGVYHVSELSWPAVNEPNSGFDWFENVDGETFDVSATNWAPYDPTANLNLPADVAFDVPGSALDSGIEAVGFYFENDGWTSLSDEFSYDIHVYIVAASGTAQDTVGETLVPGAVVLGEGWEFHPVFGTYNITFSPWIFHNEHNFLWMGLAGDFSSLFFFWHADLSSWIYSGIGTDPAYPVMYVDILGLWGTYSFEEGQRIFTPFDGSDPVIF